MTDSSNGGSLVTVVDAPRLSEEIYERLNEILDWVSAAADDR